MSRRFLKAATACGLVAFAHACTVRNIVEVVVGSVEVQPASITILQGEAQQLTAQVRDDSGEVLPNGSLTWSSDAPSVFSIDPLTGLGQALGPGQATIWATQSGVRGSGIVSVALGPSIVVSDPSLHFLARVGEPAPSPISLTITNGGGGSVGGLSASVAYPSGGPEGWVSLALSGTSAPATLTVSILVGSLGEGVYNATLVLESGDAGNSPVAVPIEAVVVLDTPVIGLSPQALDFQMEAGGAPPVARTVQVTNQGGGVLSDLQILPLYPGVGGWLAAALAETTAPTELLVEPDPSGLSPGTYLAEVRVTGPGALNTPLAVDVTLTIDVGVNDPAHSTADVPDGSAGAVTNLVVQARNGSGYALGFGGATVVVTVSGANEAGPVTATDMGDGTYAAGHTPTTAGTDDVAITMDGIPLGGSPFTSIVAEGSASPGHSAATVPAGTVGLPTNIVVQARDEYDNPLSSGGATVVVTVSGATETGPLAATDVGDGTYTASYTPTAVGTDDVAITLDGASLGGSPFSSVVGEGSPSPEHSTATVRAGIVGVPTDIVVQARDQYGSPLSSGGATVVVTVSGANEAGPFTATDVGDGTYTASYTPTAVGTDAVAITMNGVPLGGSPFGSLVGEGRASPAHSTATVPAAGTVGLATTIVVEARDQYGNLLSSGGATVVVAASGSNETGPVTATDMGDGTYIASYTPATVGTDYVAITMDGTPLGGSPFISVVAEGSASPEHSTAIVPAGTVGLPTNIAIQARNQAGYPLSGGGALVVVTVSGADDVGPIVVTDVGDGTYTASYTPATVGTDYVAITMDGAPLGGSPFISVVGAGTASPEHSTATVPPGTVGLATNIVVQARDQYGNPLSSGGASVVVTVTGANETGAVAAKDVADGTYTVSYTPTTPGADDVAITMDGASLGGSPFSSVVGVGSASPEHSTGNVPDGRKGRVTDILVQARDAYGNPLGVGGEIVVVTVSGENEVGPITATDVGDGTYTASYTPERGGTDIVVITMNGTPISGSPFTSRVRK